MHSLKQMALFAHIVEAGSISAAAERLQLSKSVLSQHLKTLEQQLGIALLQRTTRRQQLTPAGAQFYRHCQQINQQAEQAWQQAKDSQDSPQGPLRITAPHALMASLITPAVGQLMQRYPALQPQLNVSDNQQDLLDQQIDVAIRVGQSKDSNLTQRRIGQFRDVLCGERSLVARLQSQAPYIANRWQGQRIHHQLHASSGEPLEFTATPACISDSFHSCLTLIQQGCGIGLVPDFVLAQQPQLVPLFPQHQLPVNPIYVLHPYGKQAPVNVRHCIDSIEQQLGSLSTKSA